MKNPCFGKVENLVSLKLMPRFKNTLAPVSPLRMWASLL